MNPNTITKKWIAEKALDGIVIDEDLEEKAWSIVNRAKDNLSKYLKDGKIGDELIRSALMIAQLDPIFRAWNVDPHIGTIDEKDLEDLRNLISIVDSSIFRSKRICLLNPTFGEASKMVGGADVDLVIDDMIIDFKTTVKLELKSDYYYQLLGYYTLYEIDGIDNMPKENKIERICIYFSRYGKLCEIKFAEIIDRKRYSAFVDWFIKRAQQRR